jgi:hypothetical protein
MYCAFVDPRYGLWTEFNMFFVTHVTKWIEYIELTQHDVDLMADRAIFPSVQWL